MDFINLLQWPAMVMTVWAAWWIGSSQAYRRRIGFWFFIISNVLWAVWGWQIHAWALVVLQFCLCVMNLRGLKKNNPDATAAPEESKP